MKNCCKYNNMHNPSIIDILEAEKEYPFAVPALLSAYFDNNKKIPNQLFSLFHLYNSSKENKVTALEDELGRLHKNNNLYLNNLLISTPSNYENMPIINQMTEN